MIRPEPRRAFPRAITALVVVSVTVNVVIAVTVGFLAFYSVTLSQANGRNSAAVHASVTALCLAGNESRAQQITLWDHLVAVSKPPPHETPAARAQRLATTRAFLAYIHRVFAPRDCRAITH